MKPKRQFSLILIMSVIIITCSLSLAPIIQLNHFYNVEAHTVSRFDALNTELFATIPVPNGVVELDQSSNGITSPTTTHGRYLITNYQISQTHPDAVLDHYKKYFLSNGWKETVAYKDFSSYFRGTACVDVSFYGEKYSLNIWHDFWNQEFSPSDPHTKLLKFIEFGETAFARCPP